MHCSIKAALDIAPSAEIFFLFFTDAKLIFLTGIANNTSKLG
jgi:hypothetical protein